VEFIACPSCGRTKFDLPTVLNRVRAATKHLVGLDIAVMGCIVNGPGEMADADYGYVGKGGGLITLYRKRDPIKTVPQEQGVAELVALIQADGRWQEPAGDS
jgi:(E)-4-hydroxy-3-methylbut-2-enyl-diphosphate synthase